MKTNMDPAFLSRLRDFDAYPKTLQDYQVRTLAGAAVSVAGMLLMLLLFFGELSLYLTVQTDHQLSVDTTRGEKLQINFNVSFHRLPCSIISLDTMDISGEQHLDVDHDVYKQRLSSDGVPVAPREKEAEISSNKTRVKDVQDVLATHAEDPNAEDKTLQTKAGECGSCYGAEEIPGDCCNTCEQVRDAYRKRGWALMTVDGIAQCMSENHLSKLQEEQHEGCRVTGTLEVSKVAGNFHFAPGKSFSQIGLHLHDLIILSRTEYNMSHSINHVSFGHKYPGRVNSLDGVQRICDVKSGMYQYFIKVVPTKYHYVNGTVITTNQFSSTEHFRKLEGLQRGLPGVFFCYDLSPIMVTFQEKQSSFLHFLTGVCAIVGGVFTVTGLVDSTIYTGQKLAKKMQMGKLH